MFIPSLRNVTYTMVFALSLLMVGCGGGSSSGDEPSNLDASTVSQTPFALFDPVALGGTAIVPFPVDLFFVDSTSPSGFSTDTTLNIPNSTGAPFVDQANLQDGFSTVAEAFMDILGLSIDLGTANNLGTVPADRGIIIVNTNTQALLNPGIDYTVTRSSVIPTRTRLYIQWLQPLDPRTTYAVIATNNLSTTNNEAVQAGLQFLAVRSPDPIGSPNNPEPQTTPALTDAQIAQLEQIRQFLQPLFQFAGAPLGGGGLGVSRENIVLAWPFTTQSIGESLTRLNATAAPQALGVFPAPDGMGGQLSTGELGLPLPDSADIFVGSITMPYYLGTPASPTMDPTPLGTFWLSDGTNGGGNSSLPGAPPCAAFAASTSTTACFPNPAQRSTETIPVIVTVPNGNSMCPAFPPPGGYPTTIYIHGVTRSRADMLLVAPALANACQVVVAIDLPLHGITPQSSFNSLRNPNVGERTFDVDYATTTIGPTGCTQTTADPFNLAPDGIEDCSGGHFVNLGSLITSRDNLRQGEIDNIHLLRTLQAADITVVNAMGAPTGTIDTNTAVTNLLGHSLGGIVGTVVMGVNNEGTAASLAMTGGGIVKLLDGSGFFGPVLAAGLANNGVVEGTDNYETFLRFGQTIIDGGDSINYAAAANANYPIHLMEIVGEAGVSPSDGVIPNFVAQNPPTVFTAGPLSGTDPLIATMGLTIVADVNPETPSPSCTAGPDTAVQFTRGGHGSIIDPTASFATTVEQQTQVANFFGSGGAGIPINGGGGACP